MSGSYFIGVDVGSREVRCALVDSSGDVIRVQTQKIDVFSPRDGYYQQSSDQIWNSIVQLIKMLTVGIEASQVKGIGCDATCSLVLIDSDGKPVTVSPKGESEQNVMMWMDHRAGDEAEMINETKHHLLSYLGGRVSLEMQMPKLIWLKKHLPSSFQRCRYFFDLPDFLTWKLTGNDTRSQCSLVCKWMYEGSPESKHPGWNLDFMKTIGLEQLSADNFQRIGQRVCMPGHLVGRLKPEVARQLGLSSDVAVGGSLIDAHAGTLALVGTRLPPHMSVPITEKLGMICGTSSCFMLLSEEGVLVPGVWGPYYGAALEHLWLSEGGQSAAGQLLDFLVESHPAQPETRDPAVVCRSVRDRLESMAEVAGCHVQELTRHYHLYPDFRGNRSPLANPDLRGMISGLSLNSDSNNLALIYLAALQALSYSARQTIEKLEEAGAGPVKCVVLCGGLSKNPLFVETLSGALGRAVVVPRVTESVLLGSAMLGASAAGLEPTLMNVVERMSSDGSLVSESNHDVLRYHSQKYLVYLKMQCDQLFYTSLMSQ